MSNSDKLMPVFVYGSLKRGFHNFRLLSKSLFIGTGTTTHAKFDMFSYGMFPAVCEGNFKVSGEVFGVNKKTLAMLDQLEGVDSGFYSRSVQDITLDDGENLKAYMYIIPRRQLESEFVEPFEHVENGAKTWITPTPKYIKDLNTKRNMRYLKYRLMAKHGKKIKKQLTTA